MLNKEDWSPLLSQQMQKVIELVDDMLPKSRDLFVLGAGTGYDLQLLLRKRSFERVFASDISPGATALVPSRSAPATSGSCSRRSTTRPTPTRRSRRCSITTSTTS
ncbi:MAG: class I SAM-dependent methyltransferase [Myxococcota bacterium]|nr:class I SAM-dependent methyltransferase [Myxococcota bacterium]